MTEYCDKKCIFYKHKNFTVEAAGAEDMENRFSDFVNSDWAEKSFDLQPIFGLDHPFLFLPGELVTVIGDTKLGKTAFMQNLTVHLKMPVLYMSLEVHENLLFRRYLQIAHGMSKHDVIEYYKEGKRGLADRIQHIKVVTVSPQLSAIGKMIEETGARVIVIDTVDAIQLDKSDSTAKSEAIALGLKSLAMQYGVIIIGIQHISKHNAVDETGKRKTLHAHSGKGSSAFEQKSDKIIGVEASKVHKYNRFVRVLGARDESDFSAEFLMNPKTFVFERVTGGQQPAVRLRAGELPEATRVSK